MTSLHPVQSLRPGFSPLDLHNEVVVAMAVELVDSPLRILLVVVGDEGEALGL
eukprot:CAMPEP_0197655016 /NCGR_PEP_ID=MMETSP1338-20131121/39199_1 /TAXON_ID=43686 ORGANISM="Pelagodinium beii, Strain RCC1491" /NCGR_SAMPLE_ID=MMETSP1338 /ASSEMBLY_ACC=CAM_ASM_000754 /LENGTH=52 /DNA_ID=CAMNT_0043230577 /DNA_START=144 /DNA_END=299 /DNA_ORIENTATION=+